MKVLRVVRVLWQVPLGTCHGSPLPGTVHSGSQASVIAALKIIYFREPIKEQRMRASMNMYEGRRVDTVEST